MTMKRERMGEHIVKVEGRFDRHGRLLVYKLPAGDGGGSFEVAGINDRYHGAKARELRAMIQKGQHARAEKEVGHYIMAYTDGVKAWFPEGHKTKHPHVELLLRDIFFNRGGRGAAATLQIALGVHVDGNIGKVSKEAFAEALNDSDSLAKRITAARATYEKRTYPWKKSARNEKSKFWRGLSNRWANSHRAAMALKEDTV